MIKSLHLENWKSHKDTYLEFSQGTNVLIGIMGSGKTSVMQAISFGLYGTYPKLRRGGAKLEDIIKYGKQDSKILLSFLHSGTEYTIERTISKKGSDASIWKEGTLLQKGPKAVTKEVEDILKVDYDLFTKVIYSEQNNIDYFFSLRPGKRKEEIDKLLGLDRFETARTNATKIINKIKDQADFLKDRIDTEKEKEIKNKIKEMKEELGKLKRKKEIKNKELEKFKNELKILEEKTREIGEQKKEFQELKTAVIKTEEILNRISKEIKETEEIKEKPKEMDLNKKIEEFTKITKIIKEQETDILNILNKHSEALSKKAKIKTEIERDEENKRKIKEINAKLKEKNPEEIEKTLKEAEEKFENIKKEISQNKAKLSELEKSLKELSNEELSKCPVCDSILTNEHRQRLISEKTGEKEALEIKNTELTKETSVIQEDIKKKKEEKHNIELLEEKLKLIKEEERDIEKLEKQMKEYEKIIGQLEEKKKNSEKIIKEKREIKEKLKDEIRIIEEYLKKIKEKTELEQKLNEYKGKLKTIKYDEETFNKLNKQLQDKKLKSNELEFEMKIINNEIENKNEISELNKKELEKYNRVKEDIKYFKEKKEQYTIYKNCIIETQTEVRKGLIEAINTAMMEVWPIIYPYADFSKVRLEPTEKDYVCQLFRNEWKGNEWKDLEATASGGEKACLSLALRVAFAMVLTPNLSWLILDEPTHNLDAHAVRMFAETLQDKIPEIVEQTFVITHEESLLNNDFDALYKLERDKSKDEATRLERVK